MKTLSLYKLVDHVQIGHVYEHVFYSCLVNFLRSKGLISYVDYHVDARTYYNGVVQLDIFLFSVEAAKYESEITRLKIAANNNVVAGVLLQIFAERLQDAYIVDYEIIKNKLREYHAEPWKESVGDPSLVEGPVLADDGLILQDRSSQHFATLRQEVILDRSKMRISESDYWPLASVVYKALVNNLAETISDSSFCFSYESHGECTSSVVKEINLYRIDKRQATRLTDEGEVAQAALRSIAQHGLVEKLCKFLQSADYGAPLLAPDQQEVKMRTGYMVSQERWREIGTVKNILDILLATSVKFRLGQSTSSFKAANVI